MQLSNKNFLMCLSAAKTLGRKKFLIVLIRVMHFLCLFIVVRALEWHSNWKNSFVIDKIEAQKSQKDFKPIGQ